MLSPFSCGFFHPETSDDYADEPVVANSPCSTPRRSSSRRTGGGFIHRIHHHGSKDTNKNPYSSRGLDKFSALVADLEEKRKQIYAQTGSENDTFVRFVYKDSNDNVPVPIVLKLKDNKKQEEMNQQSNKKKPSNNIQHGAAGEEKMTVLPSVTQAKEDLVSIGQEAKLTKVENSKKGNKMCDMLSDVNFRRPSFYLPVVVVAILVLLAVFGRSVAILCTSIGWYAIPTFRESSHVNVVATKRRRASNSKAKAEQAKKSSENNNKMMSSAGELLTSSPRSDVSNSSTPRYRKHDHRKSW